MNSSRPDRNGWDSEQTKNLRSEIRKTNPVDKFISGIPRINGQIEIGTAAISSNLPNQSDVALSSNRCDHRMKSSPRFNELKWIMRIPGTVNFVAPTEINRPTVIKKHVAARDHASISVFKQLNNVNFPLTGKLRGFYPKAPQLSSNTSHRSHISYRYQMLLHHIVM